MNAYLCTICNESIFDHLLPNFGDTSMTLNHHCYMFYFNRGTTW